MHSAPVNTAMSTLTAFELYMAVGH